MAVTAWAVAALARTLGVPWGAAWVLGAAVAPTDATAVGVVSRLLPQRNVTLLRAESLINDGTALVIYSLAVAVTMGSEHLSAAHVSGLVALSYGGGIAAGVLVAWLGIRLRRLVRGLGETMLDNLTIILIPFSAYLLAEQVEASGVLAVVVCGLIMSQAGPSLGRAEARRQTMAFWSLAMYLLNGALFVLVGLEAQAAVRGLSGTALSEALLMVAALSCALVVVRFLFLFAAVYTTERWTGARSSGSAAWVTGPAWSVLWPDSGGPSPWRSRCPCRTPSTPVDRSPTATPSSSSPPASS
ncbi:cation:proton antiporter [Streptomyces mirabilis]|uniref:cation:proton antiporter n=1 Tax=Streptomyces mirabilis TaxID=68239 RepID=UPI00332FF1DF